MRKNLLILIVLVVISSCKSNYTRIGDKDANYIPYYLKVYEADSLYFVGDYQHSYEVLDDLFKKYEPINMQVYYELINYMKLKVILNKKVKRKEMENWITRYGVTLSRLENDSLLSSYLKGNWLNENTYSELREQFMSSVNLELREELYKMIIQDQLYRNKDYQLNIDKQNKIDSVNAKRYREIFNEYGYPSDKIIGDFSIDKKVVNIDLILLHTKDEERVNYFLPKVLEFLKKGEAPPLVYANMYDQYYLYNGEEQYFGSYSNSIDTPVKELNLRRAKIGLPNYGYEKWRFKQMFPNKEY